jgi:hypothetical protein
MRVGDKKGDWRIREGERGRGGEVGGWEKLVAVEGGFLLKLTRDDPGVARLWGQGYWDSMHTAPFGCTAHLACLNLHTIVLGELQLRKAAASCI